VKEQGRTLEEEGIDREQSDCVSSRGRQDTKPETAFTKWRSERKKETNAHPGVIAVNDKHIIANPFNDGTASEI
jgi:hypothetical protein